MDPITAALAAGGAAGLSGVAGQAVKDAYAGLKSALSARFPRLAAHLQALEERPESESKQSLLAEELVEVGAAIEREAPEAAVRAGVDLEQLRAGGSLHIEDAHGADVGVRGRDWDVKGDVRIRGARGGGGPDPNC